MWHTIGPKSFLFGTAQFTFWANGAVNYDLIVTNSIDFWLIGSRCILNGSIQSLDWNSGMELWTGMVECIMNQIAHVQYDSSTTNMVLDVKKNPFVSIVLPAVSLSFYQSCFQKGKAIEIQVTDQL